MASSPARATVLFGAVLVAVLSHTEEASADARTKARKAFQEGMRLIKAEQFRPGIEALIRANDILPHPNVQFNIAQAYLTVGDNVSALEWLEVYLDRPVLPPDSERVVLLVEKLKKAVGQAARPPPNLPDPVVPDLPPEPEPPIDVSTDQKPSAARDLMRIDQLAKDLSGLSYDRAKELSQIASRMRQLMQISGAEAVPIEEPKKEDPEKPEKEPTPISEQELRGVEAYQEQEVVVAASRKAKSKEDAPAVVWVITQREIRNRGYESVAEALRTVAGLHVIDDHVFIDVGVRGVHAGLRGMSRIIKVLIDDHPVSFRPTSGSLLGLEMIPIRAVDRIELLRGPASALYGANAFLGVLQIITRHGGDIRGGSVAGRIGIGTSTERVDGSARANPSGSVDGIVGVQEGDLAILMAAQVSQMDRSGLRIPDTSPFVTELTEGRGGVSTEDTAAPLALFGSLDLNMHQRGRLGVQAGLQRLDSHAEWLDYGALTHFTRISLSNFWVRMNYDLRVDQETGVRVFASYAQAEPNNDYSIRPLTGFTLNPNEKRHLTEDYLSQAFFGGMEMRWDIDESRLGIRIGGDLDVDVQELTTTTLVFDEQEGEHNRPGDTLEIATSDEERRNFTNVGLYLQISSSPLDFMDVIGGLRYDFQNLYGSALNGRLGAVFRATDLLYFKALYGSSYRAPAADQLYRGAAYVGDATGCLDYAPCAAVGLKPQTAHTGEVVAGIAGEHLNGQVTGYFSFVDDLILSFPNNANAFVTTNAGTYLSTGVEVEVSFSVPEPVPGLAIDGHGYFALQNTSTDIPQSLFDPAESIRSEYRESSLYPNISAGGGLDLSFAPAKIGLYLEGRYVGARRASGSNLALSLGLSNYDGDDLPGYFELDANLSTRDLYVFATGETILSLRVTDIIGSRHAEGGFRGWDIPAAGRMIFLRLIQEY